MISATSVSSSNGLPADNSTGANSVNNRPPSSDTGDNVLDFSMAMSNFKSMFPNLNVRQIEQVLRKHDGDVTNTINELLSISEFGDTSSSSGSSITSNSHLACQKKPNGVKPDPTTNQKKSSSASTSFISTVAATSSSSALSVVGGDPQQRPNCADDEKIALLMQNREFLHYLQRDTRFMHEIYGNSSHQHIQYGRRRPHSTVAYGSTPFGYSAPPPPHSGQPTYCIIGDDRWRNSRDEYFTYDPYNYGSRGAGMSGYENILFVGGCGGAGQRRRSNSSSGQAVELVERVPDGPIVDFSGGSIPNGPLIDFGDAGSSKKWADRVKSHLPLSIGGRSASSSASSSKAVVAPASHYSAQHRREKDDGDESSYIEYMEFGNEPFVDRLKNMSRNSKTLFLSLAKKFSLSKKSLNEAHWPAEMGRQASEELDFGNSAMLKPYSSDPNYSVGGSESTKRNRNRKCS